MADFTFDTSVPGANNNPSVDQSVMQTNNVSTAGIMATNHIGFGVINGGQHKAIQFNQDFSYVPIPPVTPPQLFTEPDAFALPQLRFYSGDDAHSSLQYTAATNGSSFLLGGIILKWGAFTSTSGTTTITYASLGLANFPNTAFVVLTNARSNNSNFRVTSVSPTQFQGLDGVGSFTYYFLAIGN